MGLYRTIWRWHFYAGLFVIPFILVLATTGAFYLFKPQVDAWEERAWQGLSTQDAAPPEGQRDAALAAFPGSRFHSYRLPRAEEDAAMIHLALADGTMRDVFVSPQGKVLGSLDPEARIMAVDHRIHGQLLLGRKGSWLVELAASWAIVMLATGLYLWWPKERMLAGVVWPRLGGGTRQTLRDLHAVTGFWVSGLALVLLFTGLPWADVWGSAFKTVRQEMGWVNGQRQDWSVGGRAPAPAPAADEHAAHDHAAMMAMGPDHAMPSGRGGMSPVSLGEIVARAKGEHLPFPVVVSPPGTPGPFGAPPSQGWTARSETQNRPLQATVTYDPVTAAVTGRTAFADKHPIDRIVGYGTAWHEGALFGWANQLIGLATALALVTLAITGFLMWRRRKPADRLGAPIARGAKIGAGLRVLITAFLLLLPLFTLSVAALWLFDRLALPRMPRLARWLGA